MDNRYLNLIAFFEEKTYIPDEERTVEYSDKEEGYILKGEEFREKAKRVVDEALKAIGEIKDDFEFDDNYSNINYIRAKVEAATKHIRIAREKFQIVEIFDKPVLFTNERLRTMDIPTELFRYDIRHGDNGNMVQLKNYVMVNHWGTVICKEPFDITQESDGNVYTTAEGLAMDENDYNYTGDEMTIEQYRNSYDELLQNCNPEVEQTADEMGGMNME